MNNHILHRSGVDVTSKQNNFQQQTKQYILKPNQKVYLYGDTSFSGTLIRPIERTYPPRWTVELDRGGYDSAIVAEITPINPQYIELDSAIPFDCERGSRLESISNRSVDDSDETNTFHHENRQIHSETERRIAQLEKEIERLKTQNQQVKNDNEILSKDLDIAKNIIRRAKDITPLIRISLKRVLRLAKDAVVTSA